MLFRIRLEDLWHDLNEGQRRTEEPVVIAEHPVQLKMLGRNGERVKSEDPELTEESPHNHRGLVFFIR
jgi:hypothetical protein